MSDKPVDFGKVRMATKKMDKIKEIYDELHSIVHIIEDHSSTMRQRANDLLRDADELDMKLEILFDKVHELQEDEPPSDKPN